jgi:sulfate permease, SulP family
MVDGAPTTIRTVVLDFSNMPSVDITAGTILRGLVRTLKDLGLRVEIAELRDEVVETLKIKGAERDLSPIAAHRTIDDCLAEHKN